MQVKIKSMCLYDFVYVLMFPACSSYLVNGFFHKGRCRIEAVASTANRIVTSHLL